MLEIKRLKLERSGMESLLSPLESDVLKILWRKEKSRVREIHNLLRKKRKVALTSVAVILDRLHQKGIVSRQIEIGQGGEHYIYFSRLSQNDLEQSIIEKTVNKLIDAFGSSAVAYFHERFARRKNK